MNKHAINWRCQIEMAMSTIEYVVCITRVPINYNPCGITSSNFLYDDFPNWSSSSNLNLDDHLYTENILYDKSNCALQSLRENPSPRQETPGSSWFISSIECIKWYQHMKEIHLIAKADANNIQVIQDLKLKLQLYISSTWTIINIQS